MPDAINVIKFQLLSLRENLPVWVGGADPTDEHIQRHKILGDLRAPCLGV